MKWCANRQDGHSCAVFGCSSDNAFCNRRRCFCNYGFRQSGDGCVRDYMANITVGEIHEFAEQQALSDYVVAQNIYFAVGCFAGILSAIVFAAKYKKTAVQDSKEQLLA